MNVYLDIDGVILANDKELALYADEFLQAVLNKYPDSTYWLTTHQWKGEDRTKELLGPFLQQELVKLLDKIKPTQWNQWKTEAIDFTKPFLWFDDDLFEEERAELIKRDALSNWIEVDLRKNPEQLKELTAKYFS